MLILFLCNLSVCLSFTVFILLALLYGETLVLGLGLEGSP